MNFLTYIMLGYPFLISAGVALGRPRLAVVIVGVALLISGALAWRSGFRGDALRRLAEVALMTVFVVVAAIVNEAHVFRLGPALANVAMLLSFGRTLRGGPSMVESIARVQRRDLPREVVVYCWRLTLVWCVFFGLNAGFIAWLAVYASLASWTLYTGLLGYLLAGGLFMAELVYRQRRFAEAAG
jgi:uncharacterized membrane protein